MSSPAQSLGAYLEQARQRSRLSLRQLAVASGVPMSTVNRLLKDQVTKAQPGNLARLSHALGLDAVEVFTRAGITLPGETEDADADLGALLRRRYRLTDAQAAEFIRQVNATARRPPRPSAGEEGTSHT
ncbi:MAG: helix-turn-helix domain-containing protein [Micromonosporaceae bacterium]